MSLNSFLDLDIVIYNRKRIRTLVPSPDLVNIADLRRLSVVLVNADSPSMPANHPLSTTCDYEFTKLDRSFAITGFAGGS